jgi:hypothetical protein
LEANSTSDSEAQQFAADIASLVVQRRGNGRHTYDVVDCTTSGSWPDTEIKILARKKSGSGIVGWKYLLFRDESGVPISLSHLDPTSLFQSPEHYVAELIFTLDEGIDGKTFRLGTPDQDGVRWVEED